ncbi:MAG: acetate--CoA ligase family protein, partial [bacterium]
TQIEALSLLEAFKIPTARARLATSADEAVAIAHTLGGPVALKVSSRDIEHKADVDGVKLGLVSEREIREAYDAIAQAVAERAPAACIDGMLVQQMLVGGRETIVGVARDPSFGPLIMFGLGGTLVEATRDVVFRIAPLDDDQAEEMTRAFRAAPILDAWRGSPAVDRSAVVSVIRRVGQLACECPAIVELDINPLLAGPSSAIALDARVRLRPPDERNPSGNA